MNRLKINNIYVLSRYCHNIQNTDDGLVLM